MLKAVASRVVFLDRGWAAFFKDSRLGLRVLHLVWSYGLGVEDTVGQFLIFG